jgi:hypothetical protein
MTETLDIDRETLIEISRLAEQAVNGNADAPDTELVSAAEAPSCIPSSRPPRLFQKAAEVAVAINPLNAPVLGAMVGAADLPLEPMHLTPLTSKHWGSQPRQLPISFMESTQANLTTRILQQMNAWATERCSLPDTTQGTGYDRCDRGRAVLPRKLPRSGRSYQSDIAEPRISIELRLEFCRQQVDTKRRVPRPYDEEAIENA